MRRSRAAGIVVVATLLCLASLPGSAAAQAGMAVALTPGGEVLVLRPTSGQGRAGVLVFARDTDGGWARVAALEPGPDAAPSEGFSPSLAAAGPVIVAGAGDADRRLAARPFVRDDQGAWRRAAVLPLRPARPGSEPSESAGAGALDLAGLMRIMSPPRRVVALAGDGRTLVVWAEGRDADSVRVYHGPGAGGWALAGAFPVGAGTSGGEVRLVAEGDRIVVGDPGREPAGVVRLFRRQASGAWALEAELAPEAGRDAGFGAALALDGDRLAVGVPGTAEVVVFRATAEGWGREGVVHPETPGGGPGGPGMFGMAVAWSDDGLWVGDPGADGGRGAVARFAPDPATGMWRRAERFVLPEELHAGAPVRWGWSMAASDDLVVAGAPGAERGAGGAALLERREGAWRGPVPLPTGVELRGIAGEVRCEDGRAAAFDCGNVDLLSYLTIADLGADPLESVTDLWGWADPETGREYALVGRSAGMAIVDVTRPAAPVVMAVVGASRARLRDIKVFSDHAFFVGDGAGDHGLVVFDLRRIRDLKPLPEGEPPILEPDARYTGIGSAHNLIMEPETGLAVPVGASGSGTTCGGGLHMVDVATPTEPVFAGCYTDTVGLIAPGRSHDGQCVVYRGPDRVHHGRRVCLVSNETALRIVDVTDPGDPIEIARASYPGVAYTHQGWLTEDHRYFFMNDELDELVGTTDRTRTLIWDVADLDDPVLVGEHLGPDIATDHNLFIRGDRMYQANYQAGMRVIDISDPENPRDIGFFDTTPYGPNQAGFGGGAWTAYPFLPSGTILVSSMYEGLFVLRPRSVVP